MPLEFMITNMLFMRKQAALPFAAVIQLRAEALLGNGIERRKEGEGRIAMSGYDGVGATKLFG
ncbi:hypothetical protein PQQ96_17750 [Paraburkholderia sediminicola]|uniref:hypothetical protein n=1 Tax=Paraburkholderia sediminicola TaxID=458836 RepID=UPI0038B87590